MQKKRDVGKRPVRVDRNTIILVRPENTTTHYIQDYTNRLQSYRNKLQ
jgi:hypothetical protein